MSNKIVVLNSGGFDSITLLHHIKDVHSSSEIHSLHYVHGNINRKGETRCVNNACKQLGVVNKQLKLPKMDWTTGTFYKPVFDLNTQYLESRNLIFLSYAISYAESIGANEIYLALLNSRGDYVDSSEQFVENMNRIANAVGITIFAPFINREKRDLTEYVEKYKITRDMYFSCDVPVKGKPCGKCTDCLAIDEVYEALESNSVKKDFVKGLYDTKNEAFRNSVRTTPIKTLNLIVNKESDPNSDISTGSGSKAKIYDAIKELVAQGLEHICFVEASNKPLTDLDFLWYVERLKYDNIDLTWSVTTTGILMYRFASAIKNAGCQMVTLRSENLYLKNEDISKGHLISALDECREVGLSVNIDIGLNKFNYIHIKKMIELLHEKYPDIINFIDVQTHHSSESQEMLSAGEIGEVHAQLETLDVDFLVNFSIGQDYVQVLLQSWLYFKILTKDQSYTNMHNYNYSLELEMYCESFIEKVALTPDGYVFGCVRDTLEKYYIHNAVGNIANDSIMELVNRGKDSAIDQCFDGCTRCRY